MNHNTSHPFLLPGLRVYDVSRQVSELADHPPSLVAVEIPCALRCFSPPAAPQLYGNYAAGMGLAASNNIKVIATQLFIDGKTDPEMMANLILQGGINEKIHCLDHPAGRSGRALCPNWPV
ncbi:MAG TPA: hypothetical protein PLO35_07285 [Candidatus Cloacimonadota bacterium]|nr:hypothetical protein [Candidatus Cloacimonadota bacterium]